MEAHLASNRSSPSFLLSVVRDEGSGVCHDAHANGLRCFLSRNWSLGLIRWSSILQEDCQNGI